VIAQTSKQGEKKKQRISAISEGAPNPAAAQRTEAVSQRCVVLGASSG
jgi:hypothetical protein